MDELISKLEHMASPGFANLAPEWQAVAREAAAALEAAREDAAVFAEKVDGVASFLVGYGGVAEFAAKNLRDALFEYDAAIDQARGIVPEAGQEVDGGYHRRSLDDAQSGYGA